jgi:hypothetical protein
LSPVLPRISSELEINLAIPLNSVQFNILK